MVSDVNNEKDQARLIAERVARRLAGDEKLPPKTDQIAANGDEGVRERPRARIIDFISSGPPVRSESKIGAPSKLAEQQTQDSEKTSAEFFQFIPVTQSPWHGRLQSLLGNADSRSPIPNPPPNHPSEQRFGVEEATVAELVEFFENEKKCSIDPSGKPCDHCAMCSSRGF